MKNQRMRILGAPEGAPFLKILIADTFFTRLSGLMFRNKLPGATGLFLAPCNSVHMCFMRFAIDVIYLDKDFKIIKVVQNLKPWISISMCRNAWAVVEMTAGEAKRCGCETGRKLVAEEKTANFSVSNVYNK